MNPFFLLMRKLRHSDTGTSSVEYGTMVGVIAAVTLVVVMALGATVKPAFSNLSDDLSSLQPAARRAAP